MLLAAADGLAPNTKGFTLGAAVSEAQGGKPEEPAAVPNEKVCCWLGRLTEAAAAVTAAGLAPKTNDGLAAAGAVDELQKVGKLPEADALAAALAGGIGAGGAASALAAEAAAEVPADVACWC